MARSFTVAQLMQRVRDEADMQGGFIADAELMRYLSAAYTELHGLLVQSGLAYFESETLITTGGSAASYQMPADFNGVIKVDYQTQASPALWTSLIVVQPAEENALQDPSATRALGYRVVDGTFGGGPVTNLLLFPTPPDNQVYRVRYIPAPADLTATNQTVNGVAGWEEFIVIEAAIKCLAKEGSDVSMWMQRKRDMRERIESEREIRNLGQARRIIDVYAEDRATAFDPMDRTRNWEDGWN